jgi:glucose-1-phosphate thymidylyltransferase
MNAILLAAGYGTRLYPLTLNVPKALLPVGGKPILERLIDALEEIRQIERVVLVSSAKFVGAFREWEDRARLSRPLEIIDDGSTDNTNRLGAVADVQFAVEKAGLHGEAAYVMATDNLPRFDLRDLVDTWTQRSASAVFACPVEDTACLKRMGVAELDAEGLITGFQEKPEEPRSNLRVPPFYVYTAEVLELVDRFLKEGRSPDAPGHFLEWLVSRADVYAVVREEGTFDIGTLESYRQVCEAFSRHTDQSDEGDSLDAHVKSQ